MPTDYSDNPRNSNPKFCMRILRFNTPVRGHRYCKEHMLQWRDSYYTGHTCRHLDCDNVNMPGSIYCSKHYAGLPDQAGNYYGASSEYYDFSDCPDIDSDDESEEECADSDDFYDMANEADGDSDSSFGE